VIAAFGASQSFSQRCLTNSSGRNDENRLLLGRLFHACLLRLLPLKVRGEDGANESIQHQLPKGSHISLSSQHEERGREQLTTIERDIETAAASGRRGTRTPDIFLASHQNFLPQLLTDSVAPTFGTGSDRSPPLWTVEARRGTHQEVSSSRDI